MKIGIFIYVSLLAVFAIAFWAGSRCDELLMQLPNIDCIVSEHCDAMWEKALRPYHNCIRPNQKIARFAVIGLIAKGLYDLITWRRAKRVK